MYHSSAFHTTSGDFNDQQIATIAESLFHELFENRASAAKLQQMLVFINSVPTLYHNLEPVLKAKALVLFCQRNWKQLYRFLSEHNFSPHNHGALQDLWEHAHYAEASNTKDKELDAVSKYRLRRKYPFPLTIWDGEEKAYKYKAKSRHILNEFYKNNAMPSVEDKRRLAAQSELTVIQVSNFFKNKRQRDRAAGDRSSKCDSDDSSSSGSDAAKPLRSASNSNTSSESNGVPSSLNSSGGGLTMQTNYPFTFGSFDPAQMPQFAPYSSYMPTTWPQYGYEFPQFSSGFFAATGTMPTGTIPAASIPTTSMPPEAAMAPGSAPHPFDPYNIPLKAVKEPEKGPQL